MLAKPLEFFSSIIYYMQISQVYYVIWAVCLVEYSSLKVKLSECRSQLGYDLLLINIKKLVIFKEKKDKIIDTTRIYWHFYLENIFVS